MNVPQPHGLEPLAGAVAQVQSPPHAQLVVQVHAALEQPAITALPLLPDAALMLICGGSVGFEGGEPHFALRNPTPSPCRWRIPTSSIRSSKTAISDGAIGVPARAFYCRRPGIPAPQGQRAARPAG